MVAEDYNQIKKLAFPETAHVGQIHFIKLKSTSNAKSWLCSIQVVAAAYSVMSARAY